MESENINYHTDAFISTFATLEENITDPDEIHENNLDIFPITELASLDSLFKTKFEPGSH